MQHWKTDIDDLRGQAQSVLTAPATGSGTVSARTAAACMAGIVSLVSRRFSVDVMQRACADLVRHAGWDTNLQTLAGHDGVVTEPLQLIAVVARSLLPLAGPDNLRAALAFWASEDDPAVWNRVAA
jgi:hypothetical protein